MSQSENLPIPNIPQPKHKRIVIVGDGFELDVTFAESCPRHPLMSSKITEYDPAEFTEIELFVLPVDHKCCTPSLTERDIGVPPQMVYGLLVVNSEGETQKDFS